LNFLSTTKNTKNEKISKYILNPNVVKKSGAEGGVGGGGGGVSPSTK